jgi:hypothetical protein
LSFAGTLISYWLSAADLAAAGVGDTASMAKLAAMARRRASAIHRRSLLGLVRSRSGNTKRGSVAITTAGFTDLQHEPRATVAPRRRNACI